MAIAVAVAGSQILIFFGISIDDFRVAGGLLMLLMGLNMINGEDSSAHSGTSDEQARFPGADKVAFYLMTFPMTIGPGSIAILIIYAHQVQGISGVITYAVVMIAVLAILGVSLYLGPRIAEHLTATVRGIMTRLMGMLLAAMAIGMITAGLKVLLPGLS